MQGGRKQQRGHGDVRHSPPSGALAAAHLGSELWRKFSRAKFLLTAAGVRQLFKDLKTCQRRRRCRHATFFGATKKQLQFALAKTWKILVACRKLKRRIAADVAAAAAAAAAVQLPIARKVKCLPAPPSVSLSVCLSVRLSFRPSNATAAAPRNAFTFSFHKGKQARSLSGSFKCIKHVFSTFFGFFSAFLDRKTATKILFNLWDTPRGAATECPPSSLSLTPINLIEFLAQFLKVFFGGTFPR